MIQKYILSTHFNNGGISQHFAALVYMCEDIFQLWQAKFDMVVDFFPW